MLVHTYLPELVALACSQNNARWYGANRWMLSYGCVCSGPPTLGYPPILPLASVKAKKRTLGRHVEAALPLGVDLAVIEGHLPGAGLLLHLARALAGLELEGGRLAQAAVPVLVDVEVDGRLLPAVGGVAQREVAAAVAGEPIEGPAGLQAASGTAALWGGEVDAVNDVTM